MAVFLIFAFGLQPCVDPSFFLYSAFCACLRVCPYVLEMLSVFRRADTSSGV